MKIPLSIYLDYKEVHVKSIRERGAKAFAAKKTPAYKKPRSQHIDSVNTRAMLTMAQLIKEFTTKAHAWREGFTINQARDACLAAHGARSAPSQIPHKIPGVPGEVSKPPAYSVGTFCSGGCLDTLAAIRAGFTPVWGTEICERKRAMWRSLTHSRDLGSTEDVDWSNQIVPDMIISGTPCTDFSPSGTCQGEYGPTGWMFEAQADHFLLMQPNSFCIEMVDNAVRVNGGRALASLLSKLREKYEVNDQVIRTIDHGDASNRTRIFIVGLHKRLGKVAKEFHFPAGNCPPLPARALAVPDAEVPSRFWRYHDEPLEVESK